MNVISEILDAFCTIDFWVGFSQVVLGLFSFAIVSAIIELRRTTKRLRKYVARYIEGVEFAWTNQTEDFIVLHRVRQFELLLRRVQVMRPRTPKAYRRVEEVRDALEYFHKDVIAIFRDKHITPPNLERFPFEPNEHIGLPVLEPAVRSHVLKELQSIKWLKIKVSSVPD